MSLLPLANMAGALVRKQLNAFARAKPMFSITRVGSAGNTLLELPDPTEAEVSSLAAPWLALLGC